MRLPLTSVIVLMALTLTGCAKQVHEDYPQYLVNNQGQVSYPYVGKPALYYIDDETDDHAEKIKSWLAGIANSWTVRMGDVLDATLRGEDMQASFASLARTQVVEPSDGLTLLFHLNSYEFADFRAYVDMTIEARGDGKQLLAKDYSAHGRSQGGKVGWGGGFAMKNAIQQSTKNAMDQILTRFLNDLKRAMSSNVAERGGPPEEPVSDLLPFLGGP